MIPHGMPTNLQGLVVKLHLLEPIKGHPLRTWTFHEQAVLKIGRLDDNDVVLTDPAVSRLHATLQYNGVDWDLQSLGKHGVLVGDQRIETVRLAASTVFRLGPNGPTLMFEPVEAVESESEQCTSTVEFGTSSLITLDIDRDSTAAEVRKITDDQGFQKLLEHAAELRKRRFGTTSG